MRVNRVALVLIFLLACLMITPSSAEFLEGNLTGDEEWTSYNYAYNIVNAGGPVDRIGIYAIETTVGAQTLIHYDPPNNPGTYASGAPLGYSGEPFIWQDVATGQIVAEGTFGYQRFFNTAWPTPTEIGGYQYWIFNTWNITGLSGSVALNQTMNNTYHYNSTALQNAGVCVGCPTAGVPSFYTFSGITYYMSGNYTFNKDTPFYNSYNATKPSGIGITGYVVKHLPGGSVLYNSRAYIVDGVSNHPLTSESVVSDDDYYFAVPNQTIKICVLSSNMDWYNTTMLFNVTGTVTPTSTPIAGAVYTMTTSTDYVNVSGTNTATIASLTDPTLADLKFISASYSDTPSGAETVFYEVGSTVHALSYSLVSGTWYGYDSADVDYNNAKGGLPNPLTLKWDTTDGDKTLHITLQNSAGDYTYLTRTIHVGQGTQTLIQTRAQAVDGTNGGSLGMVSMQIYNHNTQTWTNLSPNDGLGSIITPSGTILSFYAQKAGFTDGTLLNQPAQSDTIYSVNLFTGPAVGTGYVNYNIVVQDSYGQYIPGATIKITNGTTGVLFKQGASPSTGGSAIFNLTASQLYTWQVTKTGYAPQSGSFTTGTSTGSLVITMPGAVTSIRTTAPIPTGSWTVNPSYTPSGNMTGFWTPWVRVFSMMGADSIEMPILISGLIIFLCMAAGAGMAGVLGAEVAMGFGAIICVALGLIPIWVVLAIIILGFLFYGLKIGGK